MKIRPVFAAQKSDSLLELHAFMIRLIDESTLRSFQDGHLSNEKKIDPSSTVCSP